MSAGSPPVATSGAGNSPSPRDANSSANKSDKLDESGDELERKIPKLFSICAKFYLDVLQSPKSYRGSPDLTLEVLSQVIFIIIVIITITTCIIIVIIIYYYYYY